MLCRKSGSAWLDRLRTAKGFPVDTVTDLDNFLSCPNSPPLQTPRPRPKPPPPQNEDKKIFNIMTDVLNELFYFGDKCSGNSTNSKKSARKQSNPRNCAFSGNGSRGDGDEVAGKVTLLRSVESNSGVEGVKVLERWETEGERDASLVGFSRTEVTVIDTSYESWKFDKLLFRKKNVWRVRDKKGKGETVCGKKKRKMSVGVEEDLQHGAKKWKLDKKEMGEQCALPPLNEEYHQTSTSDVKDKHANKVVGTNKKKQSDLMLGNGSTSVILIKSIHAGKKTKANISKNCLKLKEKKI